MKAKMIGDMWVPEYCNHWRTIETQAQSGYKLFLGRVPTTRRAVAVDVGAHVGYWTVQMEKDFEEVYAIEPDDLNYHCLRANVKEASCFFGALGSIECRGEMLHNKNANENNSGARHVIPGKDFPVNTLDNLPINALDFLKIDVEGLEAAVLQGGHRKIRQYNPIIVIERNLAASENYGEDDDEAHRILDGWGYEIKTRRFNDFLYMREYKDA